MNKKWKLGLISAALALGVIGGAYAYYSGTAATKENTFNIVAGQKDQENAGTIEEPNWNPEDAKDLQPGQTVAKDPKIKSNVDYETWVFMKVEVPTLTAQKEGDADDKVYDAVTFTKNAGWTEIKSTPSAVAGTNSVYIYGYDTKLAAQGETTTLFDNFTVQDFTKVARGLSDSIDVSGTLIQTTGYDTQDAAATALGLK
mgnify:CR=1 FL=1